MNSLVVLFSMLALTAAKPSGALLGGELLAYSAPAAAVSHSSRLDIQTAPAAIATAAVAPFGRTLIAEPVSVVAPAAVSHQSRIDIKSEPAIVSAAAIAPIPRAVIAEPAIVTAPAAVSHQSRIDIKSEPAIVSAPAITPITRTLVAEPAIVAAPAAFSHQSRVDISSNPAIVETIAASPITYGAPLAAAAIAPTLVRTDAIAPAIINAAYATPRFIAAPSSITGPVVPLDTPEVVAARAAHFQAKAEVLTRGHSVHKRSATFIAPTTPLLASHIAYSAPLTPIAHVSPIAYSTPFITKAYSIHPW